MTVARDRLLALRNVLSVALAEYLETVRAAWSDRVTDAIGCRAHATVDARARIAGELSAPVASDDVLTSLARNLELAVADELVVAAAWHAETDPQFRVVLGCAHDDANMRFPTAGLLHLVLEPFGFDVAPTIEDDDPLVHLGLVRAGAGAQGAIALTPTARSLLAGRSFRMASGGSALPDRLRRDARVVAAALRDVEVVVVRAAPLPVARAVAEAAAFDAGLTPVPGTLPVAERRLLARGTGRLPLVELQDDSELEWHPADGPLLVVAPPDRRSFPVDAFMFDVAPPSVDDRRVHWLAQLTASGMKTRDAVPLSEALASRFTHAEPAIDRLVARARANAVVHAGRVDAASVWHATRQPPDHTLDHLATLVEPAFTLDDVVLDGETRAQLAEIVDHVELQYAVMEGWDFRSRVPRGRGVAVLFTGPPGTGKTMVAEALAHALRQDLYRVDLSAVVSKYIGETEKRLAAAFDDAERIGAVLFFDEADSLFGKRTEVRDAHDRYANLEVNFLLQRVESFTGLLVLASNRRSALDEAFTRRLRFVVRFDVPDRDARRALWQRAFPAVAECGDLDWNELAANEVTGATIQSAALRAAFRAARDGSPIDASHVAAALQREYDKLGKAFAPLAMNGSSR